jgi:hypothetical protein
MSRYYFTSLTADMFSTITGGLMYLATPRLAMTRWR